MLPVLLQLSSQLKAAIVTHGPPSKAQVLGETPEKNNPSNVQTKKQRLQPPTFKQRTQTPLMHHCDCTWRMAYGIL